MRSESRPLQVVGIGGTLRSGSSSSRALALALGAAEGAGASVELLDLEECCLPLYRPGLSLESFGSGAERLVSAAREADALIWSTSAYHGTLAGATKNALDYFEFLSGDDKPYLHAKPVGLIATAAGDTAAVNAVNALIHVAHALRAVVAPLTLPIAMGSRPFITGSGGVDEHWESRLEMLGHLVVEMAQPYAAARRREPLSDVPLGNVIRFPGSSTLEDKSRSQLCG